MSGEQLRRYQQDLPVDEGADAQTLSDFDQTATDGDQTAADLDQTAADSDQHASNRDQIAADRDQDAADHDHARRFDQDDAEEQGEYERSRRERTQSAVERDLASRTRSTSARVRDDAAARRDRMAAERDGAARARDELAASLDAEIEWLEHDSRREDGGSPVGIQILLRAAGDREQAADDRRQAARDRAEAAAEVALEGIDPLTGALLRRVGCATMQRELDRTSRTGERLLVAFVDVDGLKAVNDNRGHAAGDELLRAVAGSIMQHLCSYDVIMRLGGDEFACSLSADDESAVRERFAQISAHLAQTAKGATFTVGFAERHPDDALDDLIRRADEAMLAAGGKSPSGRRFVVA